MEKEDESAFIFNLIENVEKKGCLYDKRNPFYFNRNVKERAWKEIGVICSKSETDCKHRWKLLRERFCKELKRMEAPSGSGMCYLEEWRFLKPMLFLKDSLAPRRTHDNVEQQETEPVFDQSILSGHSLLEPPSPSPPPPKKCKPTMNSIYKKFGETLQNIEMSLAAPLEEDTSDEMFMKTVLSLMKDLPVNIKDDFQAGIMQEVYNLRKSCRNANM